MDPFGEQRGDFRIYQVNDNYVISWKGEWLDGSFATVEEALEGGRAQVSGG